MLHCSNSMINMKLHKPTSNESSLIVSKPKVTLLLYIKQKQPPEQTLNSKVVLVSIPPTRFSHYVLIIGGRQLRSVSLRCPPLASFSPCFKGQSICLPTKMKRTTLGMVI